MTQEWLPETKILQQLSEDSNAEQVARMFCLSEYYERLVFSAEYEASETLRELIVPTKCGKQLVSTCCKQHGVKEPDALLALFGHFCHHEILIDSESSDLDGIRQILDDELGQDLVRIPYIWGRLIHDKFHTDAKFNAQENIPHQLGWELLEGAPRGVFQHGFYVSGPFGVLESTEHRWIPVHPAVTCHYREGSSKRSRTLGIIPAMIGVVQAHSFLANILNHEFGAASEWSQALTWFMSKQIQGHRLDYVDVTTVVAECIVGDERTRLLEEVLKDSIDPSVRECFKSIPVLKSLKSLPPNEKSNKLNEFQQLQLLWVADSDTLVRAIDAIVTNRRINVHESEIRTPVKRPPSRAITFGSELSQFGIRAGHPEPFAHLCNSVLESHSKLEKENDLAWKLGVDPTDGLHSALTEFVRREGPGTAVERLILSSRGVTEIVAEKLGLKIGDMNLQNPTAMSRILWKFGFELPRHDNVLERLKVRIGTFEDLIGEVDGSTGEDARQKIRAEGVNLFVSVEEFLDRVISYNVWLTTNDHWNSGFKYRISEARISVAALLGSELATDHGTVTWNPTGENALGTQLTYLSAYLAAIEELSVAERSKIPSATEPITGGREQTQEYSRENLGYPSKERARRPGIHSDSTLDEFQRPFPFNHTQLWADADASEFEKYKAALKSVVKQLAKADIPGVRNGLDHQRDESRFPTEDQLSMCATYLKKAVSFAEKRLIYPVTYWFDKSIHHSFGFKDYVFESQSGDHLQLHRPSTVSSLPSVSRMHTLIFAPVNFLGAADSRLFFRLLGESEWAAYWEEYPRFFSLEASSEDDNGFEELTSLSEDDSIDFGSQ